MYINIHSHSSIEEQDTITIQNIIVPAGGEVLQPERFFSAGIHPWYISQTETELQFRALQLLLQNPCVKFLGECGLDKLKGPAPELQKDIFRRQLILAEEKKMPVLIHCVKSFAELLHLKKNLNSSVPLIIHGFNNKHALARQVLDQGFYLSFGAALLNPNSNAATIIKSIPSNRIFLETDDKEISIKEIYTCAAGLLNMSVNHLKDIIFANWMSLNIDEEI